MGFLVLSLEVKKAVMWLFFLCPGQTRQAGGTIMNEAAIHCHTSALPVTCLPNSALITSWAEPAGLQPPHWCTARDISCSGSPLPLAEVCPLSVWTCSTLKISTTSLRPRPGCKHTWFFGFRQKQPEEQIHGTRIKVKSTCPGKASLDNATREVTNCLDGLRWQNWP